MIQFRGLPGRISVLSLAAVFSVATLANAQDQPAAPKGLPAVKWPADNQPTTAKIALGKQLYFDPRLSSDDTISCASCHHPAKGWSNGEAFAKGVGGAMGGRSAPTIINTAYFRQQFWDGRAKTLEDQALGPIQAGVEMNMKLEDLIPKLNKIDGYKKQFNEVFGSDASAPAIAKAIAAYERTVLSGNAPYDEYKAGNKKALSEVVERGRKVFFGKGHCSACHVGPSLTDNSYHNIGVGMDQKKPDVGRFAISKLEGDTGAFKTPGLRDIARSAPYMHDGSLKTLEDVVEHYAKGGIDNEYLDEEVFKLRLTDQDKKDLVIFLKEGLASSDYPMHKAPKLPK
jgi:cytochrome c peroxidase